VAVLICLYSFLLTTFLTAVCGWLLMTASPQISPISLNISKALGLASSLSRRIANDDLSTFVLPHLASDFLTNYDMKHGDLRGWLNASNYGLRQLEYEKASLLREVVSLRHTLKVKQEPSSGVVNEW
jgi:hypothetical protein